VQDARKAQLFVVSARSDEGSACTSSRGRARRHDRARSHRRPHARSGDRDVRRRRGRRRRRSRRPATASDALRDALPALLTVVAADQCGAAEWQLQTTTEYARTRTQFEHPIGFFQAVKHPIVNMMLEIDRARSLVYNAACAIDHEPQTPSASRDGKAAASDTARVLLGTLRAAPRRHRLHVGVRRAHLLQTPEAQPVLPRRRDSPRAKLAELI
jgi:hypothetical protein